MGVKRLVDIDFWKDEKVIDMYSPEDKYFFLYLLTNPQTKQAGIYKLPKKIMAFQLGYSLDSVLVLLDRFENNYKIISYSHDTQEIAILNYLKYSIIKGGKPVLDCVNKDLSLINDKALIEKVYDKMQHFKDERETMVSIKEIFKKFISINDNDNDNDNDSIVPRIVDVSSENHESIGTKQPKPKPTPKQKSPLEKVVDGYTTNPLLKESLNEYVKMRIANKKKPTEYALKKILKRLDGFAKDDGGKIRIVERSTINNWTDIYDPNNNTKQNSGKMNF